MIKKRKIPEMVVKCVNTVFIRQKEQMEALKKFPLLVHSKGNLSSELNFDSEDFGCNPIQ